MRRFTPLIVLLITSAACGGSSSGGGPSSPTPSPATSTYSVSGVVREAAPTSGTLVANARIEVIDGKHAGANATTDAYGRYTLSGLSGGLSLRATKDGFDQESKGVDGTKDRVFDWMLRPTARQLSESFTRVFQYAVGGPGCWVGSYPHPCFEEVWPIHNSGAVEVRAVWSDYKPSSVGQGLYADWVTVQLLKDGQVVAQASTTAKYPETTGTVAAFTTAVDGGANYTLRVFYFFFMYSRNTVTVQLSVSRPN